MFKRLRERLACPHHYIQGLTVDIQYGKGYKYEFTCARCHKRVERWWDNPPISQSDHPMWDKKDPRYNLSPPLIRIEQIVVAK